MVLVVVGDALGVVIGESGCGWWLDVDAVECVLLARDDNGDVDPNEKDWSI